MYNYLDFEKPVQDLEGKILELKKLSESGEAVDVADEIARLEKRSQDALREVYKSLTPWQKVQVARHVDRPHCLDYVKGLFTDFTPLAGDRQFGEDAAIVGGFARFRGEPVAILGQEKGSDTKSRLKHNFGSVRPEGYRKAVRIMELADRYKVPMISLVDTAGAYPGIGAEERGQAEAIARSTSACLALKIPSMSVVIGEGGSGADGIIDLVSVPILIDPYQPEILGTLSVGFSLDARAAARFRALTNSEIVFGTGKEIQTATLPPETWPSLAPLLARKGITESVTIGSNDYIAATRILPPSARPAAIPAAAAAHSPVATAIILRSRTERLQFLSAVHKTVLLVAAAAVLVAILASYAIARTVTRPLGAVTAAMRDMAATGDLTRRIALPSGTRWEDEDARLLAATFNTMTASISRFQREAAQRERLSSLGRLSTVVAHEIRNPLMIIKTSLHGLRQEGVTPEKLGAAVADIEEEVARLNRIVSEVLDFARPIKFDRAPVDLNALCADAAKAAVPDGGSGIHLNLAPALPPVVTDAERLRLALVNILTNAKHAVGARKGAPADAIRLFTTIAPDGRIAIEVRDRGIGISQNDLSRIFDPFFTTRKTGTGLGLAITRNIIEGLGGSIAVSSAPGRGTDVRIELPPATPPA